MLQAKGFDAHSETSYSPPNVNRFPYGWRYVLKPSPTGEECYDQIPLTVEDLRHPQLEDQVPQRNAHFQAILDLASTLKTYYAEDPNIGVFGDLIMDWGIPELDRAAPDIAIIPHLKHKQADRGIFKVVEEGTRPCLVIEVTSPGQPGDDTTKVTLYARAGIPEYFLIKPHLEREVPYYKLSGYRLESGVYQPLVPDAQGRLLSQTLQFWLGVEDDGRLVRVTAAPSGQRWLTPTEMKVARQQEQVARQQEQVARQQEQAARLAAEARAQAEAQAKAQAEEARQQEQVARLAAEARAQALAAKLRALGIDPG